MNFYFGRDTEMKIKIRFWRKEENQFIRKRKDHENVPPSPVGDIHFFWSWPPPWIFNQIQITATFAPANLYFFPVSAPEIYRDPLEFSFFLHWISLEIHAFSSIFDVPPWNFLFISSTGGLRFFFWKISMKDDGS